MSERQISYEEYVAGLGDEEQERIIEAVNRGLAERQEMEGCKVTAFISVEPGFLVEGNLDDRAMEILGEVVRAEILRYRAEQESI